MRGSATSLSLKPGAADSFTSAFTYANSNDDEIAANESQTCLLHVAFGSDRTFLQHFTRRSSPMQAFDHAPPRISIQSAFPGNHAHLLHSDLRDEFQTFDV